MVLTRKHIYVLLSFMLLSVAFDYAEHLPKGYQKKVDKEIAMIWPETNISIQAMMIDEDKIDESKSIGIQNIYQLLSDVNVKGYIAHAKVPSKFDFFDIAIFYDTSFEIRSMKVLAYREDHGGEVGSKRWLKQFIGKTSDDPITLYDDIQGISGATMSCVSATRGAKEITEFISNLDLY